VKIPILSIFFESKILSYFGKISFSLYLVHWPIICFLNIAGIRLNNFNALWVFLLIIAIAHFTFSEIESRFMKLKVPTVSKRSAARRTRYFPINHDALKFSSLLILGVIVLVNLSDGINKPYILTKFESKSFENWNPPISTKISETPTSPSAIAGAASQEKKSESDNWINKISEGLSLKRLPSGQDAELQNLDSDRLSHWNSCLTILVDIPSCNLQVNQSDKKIYILGDSYAFSLVPMIFGALKKNHVNVVLRTRAQCMVPRVETLKESKIDSDCYAHRESVNSEIAREHPFLVIASSLNSNAINGSDQDLQNGMIDEYKFLKKNSQNFLVIGETPYMKDPRTCISAGGKMDKCIGSSADRKKYRELTHKAVNVVGSDYLDITNWICLGLRCPLLIDGTFVTWDGGHLTARFSEKLSDRLFAKLNELYFH
jgi:hypothetical protein